MRDKITRLAGTGAFGASAGFLALFLLIVYGTRPTNTGGMNAATAAVLWISLGGLFFALMAVHMVIGRQLLLLSRGWDARHPL